MAALEAGIDPIKEFNAIQGGAPKDFHTFAMMKGRLLCDTNPLNGFA